MATLAVPVAPAFAATNETVIRAAATDASPTRSASVEPEATDRAGRADRAGCRPSHQPDPMSLEAARDAHRRAARRRYWRLRDAARPGAFLDAVEAVFSFERLESTPPCPDELADLGEMLFEHEFTGADGLGSASASPEGPFRRIHEGRFGGPETNGCPSCHWVGGPAGAGAETDNALLAGDGERLRSADPRNPPALIALGVVEALAREMTAELQAQRAMLLEQVAREGRGAHARLHAKGVQFGTLAAGADGTLDTSGVEGIDPDLVVRPFGWKGTLASIAEFNDEALQMHLGVQSEAAVARGERALLVPAAAGGSRQAPAGAADPLDPDGDGHTRELGAGPSAALAMHLALGELPIIDPLMQNQALEPAAEGLRAPTTTSFVDDFIHGRELFHGIGCAGCHTPHMLLRDPVIEVEGTGRVDLSRWMRAPKLSYDAEAGGYRVWLFSDLKRHDMGAANESRHTYGDVAPGLYITPRLWGVADSAPYLHDGRAPSLDLAIAGHDGEAAPSRDAFAALDYEERGHVRVYLMSLRRGSRLIVP